MCFCILFARFNVLELRGEGRIISGLAETLPSHAFTSGFSVNNKIVIVFMSYNVLAHPCLRQSSLQVLSAAQRANSVGLR